LDIAAGRSAPRVKHAPLLRDAPHRRLIHTCACSRFRCEADPSVPSAFNGLGCDGDARDDRLVVEVSVTTGGCFLHGCSCPQRALTLTLTLCPGVLK
jgi:hypothetical protein